MTEAAQSYQPADQLHLWLLTQPERPVLIGELNLVRSVQGVSLRYAKTCGDTNTEQQHTH